METPVKKDEKQSRRSKLWISIIGVIVILFLTYTFSPRTSPRFVRNNAITPPNTSYGIITVTTTGSKTIYTGGNNFVGVPLAKVSWEEYYDDKYVRTLTPAPVKDSMDIRFVNIPCNMVSWKLAQNQGVDSVQFAYYLFKGSTPPSDWYDTVLRNCRQ